jgi:hypothetical protein
MTPLLNDDVALVIHPNMTNDKWNGTVDVQIVVMPIDKMSKDNLEEVFYIMQGLVAAFNLMNTDEAFAQRISQELERMAEAGELISHTGNKDNVISIDQWTKTKGNA